MTRIGRRIYYDKTTGNVIVVLSERFGAVSTTTLAQDIAAYKALSERNPASFAYIDLEYGAFRQDFAECSGFRVNPATKALEFAYPDPKAPEAPPVFQKPLTEQIAELRENQADLWELILFGG